VVLDEDVEAAEPDSEEPADSEAEELEEDACAGASEPVEADRESLR
jgi:hypothetical protein